VGLLGATSKLSPKTILEYNYGSYKGYYAENFIAQEFLASGEENFFCWQENTSEVEFLREFNGNMIIPIEVKSGWVTQAKSLKIYAKKYNPQFRAIFSANNITIDKLNKVYHLPLYLAAKINLLATCN
jgi:predicted AAA+ superfamily ATPase